MEDVGSRSGKKRGRKRKQIDVASVEGDKDGKKKLRETRSKALLGRYVRKEFQGSGLYLGKVVHYDSGLYRVDYEDGDCEDLTSGELRPILVEESEFTDEWFERKTKLDDLLLNKYVKKEENLNAEVSNVDPVGLDKVLMEGVNMQVENLVILGAPEVVCNDRVNTVDSSKVLNDDCVNSSVMHLAPVRLENGFTHSNVERSEVVASGLQMDGASNEPVELRFDVDGATDSLSDSCEEDLEEDQSSEEDVPVVPCPQLPPSSGNIGIPEEYVAHLLSVYCFLRSFSVQLFLNPFSLDDFVGSLNCSVSNTLLDSIHVSLMRALRRYFEKLSSDGSELAAKCLRSIDWSLLDSVTWPVYLIQYLMLMGYTDGPEWKGFYTHSLEREYYSLPVGRKLVILQILCDDVLDSEDLRTEIDIREGSEVGAEFEDDLSVAPVHVPRRVHPRNSKTSACQVKEARQIISQSHETNSCWNSGQLVPEASWQVSSSNGDQDANSDECLLCGMEGTLLCCDGCPASYHSRCIGVMKMFLPEGPWYCPECSINKVGPKISRGTALKGSNVFGIDLYGQVFVGTCDHLLVSDSRSNGASCLRYYCPSDISNVLQALLSNKQHVSIYSGICKEIVQYWEIPEDMVFLEEASEVDDSKVTAPSPVKLLDTEGHSVLGITECEDNVSCVTGNNFGIMLPNNSFCNTMTTTDGSGQIAFGEVTTEQSNSLVKTMLPGAMQGTNTRFSGPFSQNALSSNLCRNEKSGVAFATCTSRNITGSCSQNLNPSCLSSKLTIQHNEERVGVGGRYKHGNNAFYLGSSFKIHGYVNNYLHGEFAASAAANMAALSSEENHVTVAERRKAASAISANMALQVKAFSSAAVRFFWPHTEKKLLEVPRERCSWCLSCMAPVVSKKGCLLNAAASNAIKGSMKILATLRPIKIGEGSLPGIATYIIFMEESLSGLTTGPFKTVSFRAQWRSQMEQVKTCFEIKFLLLELEENIRTIALSGDWVKLVDGSSAELSVIQHATTSAGSTQKRRPGKRGRKPSTTNETNPDDDQDTSTHFTWWRGGMLSAMLLQKGLLPRLLVKKASRQGGKTKIPGIYYAEGSELGKRSRRLVWRAAVDMSRTLSQLALQVRYLDHHVRWSELVHPEGVQEKGLETEASAFRNAYICDKKILENEISYCVVFEKQKHLPSRVMKSIIEVEQTQDETQKYWFPETRIPLYLIKRYEHAGEVPSVDKPVTVKAKLHKRRSKTSMTDILLFLARKRNNVERQCCAFCKLEVLLSDRHSVRCNVCEGLCHEQCTSSSIAFYSDGADYVFTCKHCCNSQTQVQSRSSNGSPTSPLLLKGQEFPNTIRPNESERIPALDQTLASVDSQQSPELKPSTSFNLAPKNNRTWGLIWKKKKNDDGTEFRLNNIVLRGKSILDSPPVCHLCQQPYNSDLMYIRCESCTNWFHAEAVELEESKIFELVGFKCCKCRRIKSPICPYKLVKEKRTEERKIRIKGPKAEDLDKQKDLGSVSRPFQVGQEDKAATPQFFHSRVEQSSQFDPNAYNGWSNDNLSGSAPPKPPVSQKREEKKIIIKGPKLEVLEYKPDFSAFAEQIQTDNSNSVLSRREDSVEAAFNDSLFYSHPRMEEYPQFNSTSGYEWNGVNLPGPAPQKLPVRRQSKHEKDTICSTASDPSHVESETFRESTGNAAEESLQYVQWGVPASGFDDGMTFNYDDMEFEPQTYFSFNELLASNDSVPPNGVESSADVTQNFNQLLASNDFVPPNGVESSADVTQNWELFQDYGVTDVYNGQQESSQTVELAYDMVPCRACSQADPPPELFCPMCGLFIHSHCSPWDEPSANYDGWKCGNCREDM